LEVIHELTARAGRPRHTQQTSSEPELRLAA
jgi:hypothetical protein